jgi:putative acyl-CoA dehydrogenase
MVQSTRLDCTLGSAGGARKALQLALNHASTRNAFGQTLIDQPLMRNLLTDLCVSAEAHTLTAMYMAVAFDKCYSSHPFSPSNNNIDCISNSGSHSINAHDMNANANADAQELFRIGVTVSKYFVTKALPHFSYECMEVFGGNGFVEDFPIAKLFRQSPLNAIWEGSGNVNYLSVIYSCFQLLIFIFCVCIYLGNCT